MISAVRGVVMSPEDAAVILSALEQHERLLAERMPPNLRAIVLHLRRAVAKTGVSSQINASAPTTDLPADRVADASSDARNALLQLDSAHNSDCATLTSAEAAAVLNITANGVRDLRRRGRIRGERVAGRWQFDAAQITARASSTKE